MGDVEHASESSGESAWHPPRLRRLHGADVSGGNKIGMEEVIYIIQAVAGVR